MAVPVKALPAAKTRLAGVLSPAGRAGLVLAMAADVLSAARSAATVTRVLLVTPDRRVADRLATGGVDVLLETGSSSLNGAFRQAAAAVPDTALALLTADLPLLHGSDLDDALGRVPPFSAGVVSDAEGTGTTLLAARRGRMLEPRFGPASRTRHRLGGAVDLTHQLGSGAGEGLRRDIDTEPALTSVRDHPRLGPATAAWIGTHLIGAA